MEAGVGLSVGRPVLSKRDWLTGLGTEYIDLFLRYTFPLVLVQSERAEARALTHIEAEFERFQEWLGYITGIVMCGSTSEGLHIPQYVIGKSMERADVDRNQIFPNTYFSVKDGRQVKMFQEPEAIEGNPRFVRLRITVQYQYLHLPFGYRRSPYLSAKYVRSHLLQMWESIPKKENVPGSLGIDGPSIQSKQALESDENSYSVEGAYDFVVALECDWPKQAQEWVDRCRPSGWPSASLINHIVKTCGCHATPTGRGPDIWRLSFSMAEKLLAYSLSSVQVKAYMLLKLILKTDSTLKGLISSYVLKNMLFWICEEVPGRRWFDGGVIQIVTHLLDRLIRHVAMNNLPHYIIRKSNLMDGKSHTHRLTILKALSKIRRESHQIFYTFFMDAAIVTLSWSVDLYYGNNFRVVYADIMKAGVNQTSSKDTMAQFCSSCVPLLRKLLDEFLRYLFVYMNCDDDKKSLAQEATKRHQMYILARMICMISNDYFRLTGDSSILHDRIIGKLAPAKEAALIFDVLFHNAGRCLASSSGSQIMRTFADRFQHQANMPQHRTVQEYYIKLMKKVEEYSAVANNPKCPGLNSVAELTYKVYQPAIIHSMLKNHGKEYEKYCREMNIVIPKEKPLIAHEMQHLDARTDAVDKTNFKFRKHLIQSHPAYFVKKPPGDIDTLKRAFKYCYNSMQL